jgi:pimeloyl-ACP methyl ester carboxylesterase
MQEVTIPAGEVELPGFFEAPASPKGLVLFAHGSGSSRLSPRNAQVAAYLSGIGIAKLLFDLLTEEEAADRGNVFDIELLAERLDAARALAAAGEKTAELRLGYFGASTGAAAALRAAADHPQGIAAVVSRGGRPDLAAPRLAAVQAPTLLIVGGEDHTVLDLNRQAQSEMTCEVELAVIPGATHLFEEPGALEEVSRLAGEWFLRHFA